MRHNGVFKNWQDFQLSPRALRDNYERKKVYHEMYMAKLKKAVAEEDNRRRSRIAEWESFFAKKHKDTLGKYVTTVILPQVQW